MKKKKKESHRLCSSYLREISAAFDSATLKIFQDKDEPGLSSADSGCCEDNRSSPSLSDDMPEPKEDDVSGVVANAPDEELTLDLDHVPEEVQEYARRELGETEEVKCQTIHELREMIYGGRAFTAIVT